MHQCLLSYDISIPKGWHQLLKMGPVVVLWSCGPAGKQSFTLCTDIQHWLYTVYTSYTNNTSLQHTYTGLYRYKHVYMYALCFCAHKPKYGYVLNIKEYLSLPRGNGGIKPRGPERKRVASIYDHYNALWRRHIIIMTPWSFLLLMCLWGNRWDVWPLINKWEYTCIYIWIYWKLS